MFNGGLLGTASDSREARGDGAPTVGLSQEKTPKSTHHPRDSLGGEGSAESRSFLESRYDPFGL